MKETLKNNKGITLVTLVVTIIILIILAGISINMLIGTDGLITKAKQAKENIELAEIEEQTRLNELYSQLDNGLTGTGNSFAEQTAGTATSDKVLKDYTAFVNGQLVTGTMENRGTLNWNPSESTSLTIEPGYYSGGTISTANAFNAGYNTFDETRLKVLETGTFDTGNINYKQDANITINLKNNYVQSQEARIVITGFISGYHLFGYFPYSHLTANVTGNTVPFNVWN